MEFLESQPFRIEQLDGKRAVVQFAPICDHARTKEHEDNLSQLVERADIVAADLSGTTSISSDWLRWLGRLTIKAQQTGKVFAVIGMNETVRSTADVLALGDQLKLAGTIEEVWRL